jgi:hypothetical protein
MANYDDWKADDTTWEDRQPEPIRADYVVTLGVGQNIALVEPKNNAAARYLADRVGQDSSWFGRSLVVETRYLEPLLEQLE